MDIDPIAEVRRSRESLLDKYGGIDGLHRHMDDEVHELEKQGWHFISAEKVLTRKQYQASIEESIASI
jgi:hypothetical protein